MRKRYDGSNQSANTPTYNQTGNSREDHNLYRCMITKVVYADDPKNVTKNSQNPEVVYEVVILGGHAAGQLLSNVRLSSKFSGVNYSEINLTPTSKDLAKVRLMQHDGDIVWVQMNQGHDGYPIITRLGKGISNKIAATKAEGPRLIEEFNGLVQNITNKGEYSKAMKGGSTKDGRFTPGTDPLIKEEWTSAQVVKRSFKSGMSITEDGTNDSVTVNTSGGVVATIDGKGNKVSMKAGATEIIIDGASGKIQLKGEFVDLGASVADMVTMFTQLASAFATHTHTGNLGAPTSPPMAPLLSSVGSQTVKVQG